MYGYRIKINQHTYSILYIRESVIFANINLNSLLKLYYIPNFEHKYNI